MVLRVEINLGSKVKVGRGVDWRIEHCRRRVETMINCMIYIAWRC